MGRMLAALLLLRGAGGDGAGDAALLDWESSSWRYHLTYRPPRFSAPTQDRKGRAYEYLSYERGWHVVPVQGRIFSPDPPAEWTRPEFEDSTWPRERQPQAGSEKYAPVVRVKRLRGRFEVADPARVTKLALEMEFVGGVAVHLNGTEVGRAHLPAGALTADVAAEGYPEEAYVEPGAKWGMADEGNEERPPSAKALSLRRRRLALAVDPKLLRAGTNVLAISIHQSAYHPYASTWSWTCGGMGGNIATWVHLALRNLTLKASPPPAATRPAGVQVWAEDIHRRVVNRDVGEAGGRSPILRIVGVRNGTHSSQIVVRAGTTLERLSATASDLTEVGGAGRIPAGALVVRYGSGTPLEALKEIYANRASSLLTPPANRILGTYSSARYKSHQDRVRPGKEILAEVRSIQVFDHLTAHPAAEVPAESCRPVWLTVRIPKDTPPGEYRGTLTVRAGAHKPVEVRLFVMDWTLPEPREFTSFVGLQQSIWASCAAYNVAPGSEDHWRHVERSIELLAGVGNDTAVLPLICGGEGANEESLVPWVKKGGGHEYDWKALDRYLDLVGRHWGKKIAVIGEICWAPHTEKGWVLRHPAVSLSGGKETVALPKPGSEEWSRDVAPFAKAVAERVKSKGFERFFWGWFYDGVPADLQELIKAISAAVPGVAWARASHEGFRQQPAKNLDMHIRVFPQAFNKAGEPESRRGWQNPNNVLFPRSASEVMAIGPFESPMAMRWLVENCLVNGASGVGRLGADFWPPFEFANWYHPFVPYLLHPGPRGAEAGQLFETLREGVQEAEARIYLEREGKDQTEPAKSVLAERIRLLGAIPSGPLYTLLGEYSAGWQERSWKLYAAAAAASGGKVPAAAEEARFWGRGEVR